MAKNHENNNPGVIGVAKMKANRRRMAYLSIINLQRVYLRAAVTPAAKADGIVQLRTA